MNEPSDALVFFGATGDLAYKKIFPALQAMVRRGHLNVPVIGVGKDLHLHGDVSRELNEPCHLFRRLFEMSAELETHRREQLVLIVRFATRAEALIERCGEHRHWHGLVDGGLDRPPAFSRI